MQRWLVAVLFVVAGCKTIPVTPQSTLEALAANRSAFITGAPIALGAPLVLNREDFVYDAKLSADGKRAAFSRLGSRGFHVATFAKSQKLSDPLVNGVEFDVESLEFSPDGSQVAAVSRDGSLRVLDVTTGEITASWRGDEPLVSVAWSGDRLAVGSAAGLITLLSSSLKWLGELRTHTDEVRALAFRPDGSVVSASWDRSLQRLVFADDVAVETRVHFERVDGAIHVRVLLGDQMVVAAFDARAQSVLIRKDLAQHFAETPGTSMVTTSLGPQIVKKRKASSLAFKNVVFGELDVGVCDACVPTGAQMVIGSSVLDRLTWAIDESELVIIPKDPTMQVRGSALQRVQRYEFAAAINDMSLDARGETVGLAFSETRAERTPDVYEREKRNELEPERDWDCAARVKLSNGKILERVHGHRGVVSTAAISPDGNTLVTGGWDKRLHAKFVDERFGWSLRRVRFSHDGTKLIVGAWTPLNALGNHQSDPSAVVYDVVYDASATVTTE